MMSSALTVVSPDTSLEEAVIVDGGDEVLVIVVYEARIWWAW